MADPTEKWRPVKRDAGYEVSSLGRVRSVDRLKTDQLGRARRYRGRVLSVMVSTDGSNRPYVRLSGVPTRAFWWPKNF